jgi:hypothetical protein
MQDIPADLLPRILVSPIAAAALASTCRRFLRDVRRDIFVLDTPTSSISSEFYTHSREDLIKEGLFVKSIHPCALNLATWSVERSGQVGRPEWLNYTMLGDSVVYKLINSPQIGPYHSGFVRVLDRGLTTSVIFFTDGKLPEMDTGDTVVGVYTIAVCAVAARLY